MRRDFCFDLPSSCEFLDHIQPKVRWRPFVGVFELRVWWWELTPDHQTPPVALLLRPGQATSREREEREVEPIVE